MTDAGGLLPKRDTAESDERARLLRQIADTLNLPLSAFWPTLAPAASPGEPSSAECAAALAAFSRIRDPETRRHCLSMLERCADA